MTPRLRGRWHLIFPVVCGEVGFILGTAITIESPWLLLLAVLIIGAVAGLLLLDTREGPCRPQKGTRQ